MMQKVTKTFFCERVHEIDPVSLLWPLLGAEII